MSTAELSRPASFTIAPIAFDVSMEQIEELRREYLPLAILDVNNKVEVEAVHAARMNCVRLRRGVEKYAKEARDEYNKRAKDIIAAERALTNPISEIEKHLENEEGKVAREKARIQREAEERQAEMVRGRLQSLANVGFIALPSDVASLTAEQFNELFSRKADEKQARDEEAAAAAAEQVRINEENRIEAARIRKEREEMERQRQEQQAALDKQRAEQDAAQAKIDAENKRIADAEAAAQRAAELEQAKRDAAEKARLDAIAEQERKAAEAKAVAEAEERERKEAEALRPDHEKLLAVADAVLAIEVPTLVSPAAADAASSIAVILANCVAEIRDKANQLVAKRKRKPAAK